MSPFARLLAAIGRQQDEILIISHMAPGDRMANIWTTVADAPDVVEQLSGKAHVWFSVQPVKGRNSDGKGRSRAENVAGLVTLYADLDWKEGALTEQQSMTLILTLSRILGTLPTAIVRSGGGLQPYWSLDDLVDPGMAELLLAAWRQLVIGQAALLGGKADSGVYDLPRILRVPGPPNLKAEYGEGGAETGVSFPGGTPLAYGDVFQKISSALEKLPEDVRFLSVPPERTASGLTPVVGRDQGTPWDAFEATAEWDEILTPYGWVLHSRDSDGTLNWTRPGKNPRDGFSATTGHSPARDRMYVFTSADSVFAQGELVSKPEAYCRLTHAGDRAAATRALSKAGYGEAATIDDWALRRAEAVAVAQIVLADPEATEEAKQAALETLDRPLFVDLAALRSGGIEKPGPTVLVRRDGHQLFYAGCVNVAYGDPEGGKTWVVLAAVAESLRAGGRAAFIDLDHNGAGSIMERLELLGVPDHIVDNPERFLLAEPDDAEHLMDVVSALRGGLEGLEEFCHPVGEVATVVGIDSIGELIPMLNGDSNSADDYTSANRKVMTALAKAGACVIAVDHMAKGAESRAMGATGTIAKRRAVDGLQVKVVASGVKPFAPGRGGSCLLFVGKDRHGGVRQFAGEGKEPPCGELFLGAPDIATGATRWWIENPRTGLEGAGQVEQPTVIDMRIRRDLLNLIIKNPGGLSQNMIVTDRSVVGRATSKRDELAYLVTSGLVFQEKIKSAWTYSPVQTANLELEAANLKDELLKFE